MTEKFLDKVYSSNLNEASVSKAATSNLFSIQTIDDPATAKAKKTNGIVINVTSNHSTLDDLDDNDDNGSGELYHSSHRINIKDKYLKEMSNSIHDSVKQQIKKRGAEANLKSKTDNNLFSAHTTSDSSSHRKQKLVTNKNTNNTNKNGNAINKKQLSNENVHSETDMSNNDNQMPSRNGGGILVKAVTVDHSKDYTSSSSSSSEDENLRANEVRSNVRKSKLLSTSELILNSNSSLQEQSPTISTNASDSKQHHRFIKNMFLLNEYNGGSGSKLGTAGGDRIPTLCKANSYNNSSLDEGQSNILVAPLELQTPTRHLSVNSNNNQNQNHSGGGNSRSKAEFDDEPTGSASDERQAASDEMGNPNLDLTMFDLLDKTSKKFVLKPATLGLNIRCQIYRQKGLYPKYRFYMENLDGNLLLLMTARKKKKTKVPCYVISTLTYDLDNLEKYIETPIAKLKSNLLGTYFRLYDFGVKPLPVVASSLNTSNGTGKKQSRSSSFSRNNFTGSTNNLTASHTFMPNQSSNNNNSTANIASMSLSKQDSDLSDNCDESRLNWTGMDKDVCRKEYLSLFYELNMLGFKVNLPFFFNSSLLGFINFQMHFLFCRHQGSTSNVRAHTWHGQQLQPRGLSTQESERFAVRVMAQD
jgi:hypothetical protein